MRLLSIVRAPALILAAVILAPGLASAQEFETAARQAILVDFETGAVLFEKNAEAPMFPASMTKIMTAYLTFDRLREGSLDLGDTFRVSERAWRMGGSKMFVDVGGDVSVADLLRGVIVQSGNDASIVLAEGIAGSEDVFAALMTDRALGLGMTGTVFTNATGWPDNNHVTTAHDLATLAASMIRDFPEFYPLFAETGFTYNGISQDNRNPLLFLDVGADGLKTGHTEAAGYGLTASAVRDDRRLVLVINGLDSVRARSDEATRLLGWGFANFDNHQLFAAGEPVGDAEVWMGRDDAVALTLGEDLTVTLGRLARQDLTVSVRYVGPVAAPIAAGAELATLVVEAPGMEPVEQPLYAAASVERLGFFARQTRRLNNFVFGTLQPAS